MSKQEEIQFRAVTTGHYAWEVIHNDKVIGEIIQWRLEPAAFMLKFPFETREEAERTISEWISPSR